MSETRWPELDPRSLALGRVVLGLFVLIEVLQMAPFMGAFFSDHGVLPREVLLRSPFAEEWICLHMGTGGVETPAVLGLLLAAMAIGLMVGWRTPWMTLGCWVLLNSMQARNPFLFDRGDLELSLMLFWGFFLPLGGRWSWDARHGRDPGWRAPGGLAGGALVTQFALIYLLAAYHKNGEFWLGRGDGLEHSLISPLFATPLSLWLAQSAAPWLKTLNFAVVAGEVFVALLLLCPWSVALTRGLAVLLLLLFHGAVGWLFQLGLFPWLGALLPLMLLPREFWDGWARPLSRALDRRLGQSEMASPPPSKPWRRLRDATLVLGLLLALASNLNAIRPGWIPQFVLNLARALRLAQHWELFSPIPPYYGSFVLEGKSAEGESVTLFAGPPTREEPSLAPFPNHRFRMLMLASLYPDFALIRPGLVRVLARRAGNTEPGFYGFRIRVPDENGKLRPAVTWALWPTGMASPESSPGRQDSPSPPALPSPEVP